MALANPMEAFIWGAGGSRKTPDQIAREREIAEALMAQGYDTSPVGHWAEGLARMANVASGKIREGRAERAEQENATASQQRIASMLGGMGGSASAFPAAPAPAGGAAPTAARPNMGDVASNRVASAHGDETASYIRSGLVQRGLPEHVADAFVMNFRDESGLNPGINEIEPLVPGSRGGYGLYQLTGPRRRAYEAYVAERGVAPNDIDAQLDFMMSELQGPEARAAQSIFAAKDTPTAAAAIVNNFLRPAEEHRLSRAQRYLASAAPTSAVGANEAMASGQMARGPTIINPGIIGGAASAPPDPNIAPEWATNPNMGGVPPVEATALAPIETQATEPMAAPMLPEPQTVQDRPVAPVERVAQAMFPMEEMAGMNPRALPSPGGGINPAVMEALSNPYASAQERQIAGVLLEQQMRQQQEANDPMRRIEMERAQLELDQMRNPRPRFTNVGGGYIFNENTGEFMAAPNQREQGFRRATPEEAAAFGVPGGQFGPDGRFYPVNPPSGMAIEADGQGGIRVVQGAGVQNKPFTEGQSKDNVYSTRARGALPTINALEQNLTSLGDRALDYDPTGIVRGRAQDEDYQVAKAAGDEFLQAILRKDTGAAITVPEQELYGKTYLPQPGDGPEVIAYKRKARERAVAAIESGMSPAQMVAQERALAASGGNAPMDPNAVPEGVDPADWEYMTDEEKAMFR